MSSVPHSCSALALVTFFAVVMFLSGDAGANPSPELPSDSESWVNTTRISLEDVRGKAVFLWFFEEQ